MGWRVRVGEDHTCVLLETYGPSNSKVPLDLTVRFSIYAMLVDEILGDR
jgi:hypothetical protein